MFILILLRHLTNRAHAFTTVMAISWIFLSALFLLHEPFLISSNIIPFNINGLQKEQVSQKDMLDRLTKLEEKVSGLSAVQTDRSGSLDGQETVSAEVETRLKEVDQKVEALSKKADTIQASFERRLSESNPAVDPEKFQNLSTSVDNTDSVVSSLKNDLASAKSSIGEAAVKMKLLDTYISVLANEVTGDGICQAKGNLALDKSSTDHQGNDGTDLCFFLGQESTTYWQVDLGGYYDIHNINIRTCWGQWGQLAKSAPITVYDYNPATCADARGFHFATTPADMGPEQTKAFHGSTPFPVRYVAVASGSQPELSIREVTVFGTGPKQKNVTQILGPNKRVTNVLFTATVSAQIHCERICQMDSKCFAYSFKTNAEDNCLLSECPSTTGASDWTTIITESFHC